MNNRSRVKLAQVRTLNNYVAALMIKQGASEQEIAKLKAMRDRSLVWDLLRHVGYRGLQGAGIGALGLGAYGGVAGYNAPKEISPDLSPAGKAVVGSLGAGAGGAFLGWHTGGTLGALESLITYNQRRQEAKDKLKELGIE